MAVIDKEYESKKLKRRLASTGNGEECLCCRKHGKRIPRSDRYKNKRRK